MPAAPAKSPIGYRSILVSGSAGTPNVGNPGPSPEPLQKPTTPLKTATPPTSAPTKTQPTYPAWLLAAIQAAGLSGLNLNWTLQSNGSYAAIDPHDPEQQFTYNPNWNGGAGGWDVSNPYTGQYDSGLKSWPLTLQAALLAFGGPGGAGAPDAYDYFEPQTTSTPTTTTTTPSSTTTPNPYAAEEAAAAQLLEGQASVPGSGSIAGDVPVASTTTQSSGGDTTLALIAVVAVIGLLVYYFWRKHKKKTAAHE